MTISGGRRVLLNVSVDLKSLTVSADSELIWANIPNLELRAGYIVVDGAFHVGSKSCRIKHPVSIKLTGNGGALLAFLILLLVEVVEEVDCILLDGTFNNLA